MGIPPPAKISRTAKTIPLLIDHYFVDLTCLTHHVLHTNFFIISLQSSIHVLTFSSFTN